MKIIFHRQNYLKERTDCKTLTILLHPTLPKSVAKKCFLGRQFYSSAVIFNMADEREAPCALTYKVLAECSTSKARTAILTLPHYDVETPVFMPVGTQGTMKGLTSKQLADLDCQIILGNTYHLGMRPVNKLAVLDYKGHDHIIIIFIIK